MYTLPIKLAAQLTNCLLEAAGKPTYACRSDDDVQNCMRPLQGDSWATYTNIFSHVSSICQYYELIKQSEDVGRAVGKINTASESLLSSL